MVLCLFDFYIYIRNLNKSCIGGRSLTNTLFAERVVTISSQLRPNETNKTVCVAEVSGEKISTVRNWLFNKKAPPKAKKLTIADRLGVDVRYLFESGDFSVPLTQYDEALNCYVIPKVTLEQLSGIFQNKPLPINDRIVTSIDPQLVQELGDVRKTYSVSSNDIHYAPFISKNDTVIFNVSSEAVKGNLCLHISECIQILLYDSTGTFVNAQDQNVEIKSKDKVLPIIMTVSSRYARAISGSQ